MGAGEKGRTVPVLLLIPVAAVSRFPMFGAT